MKRFAVRFLNVPTLGRSFDSFVAAVQFGQSCGFEFAVDEGAAVVASWSPLYGLRMHEARR